MARSSSRIFLPCALVLAASVFSLAQAPPSRHASAYATPKKTGPEVDPRIAAALKQVSAERIRNTIAKLVSFGNRNTIGPADAASIARGFGVGAAREWIKSEFERYSASCGGCLEVKLDSFHQEAADRIPKPVEIANVYAVLRGTESSAGGRIYVVTGHYDSRNSDTLNVTDAAPGANDDGSGTAVSLECARVLSKLRFPATIIFLTVAGEEQGLNGSRHFARMARDEGWQVGGVLNNDIVGGNRSREQDPSIVRVFSEGIPAAATDADIKQIRAVGGENDSPSRQLARYVREMGRVYLPGSFGPKMIFRRDRFLRGGDHTAFNENGFAAVRFTEYREDFNRQHQNVRTANGIEYGDLPKFVDFDYVANVARLNAAVLASLASAPAPPANVKVMTQELENSTRLTWEAAPDGLAKGFEVLWRPTTSAEWENVEPMVTGTETRLERSKDNVQFAVRSVGKSGHRSLPVVPVPQR